VLVDPPAFGRARPGCPATAGVGKQTIYRWWPSKGAVLLDAAIEQARLQAPATDTGTLAGDLKAFLAATFRTVNANKTLLRNSVAEALREATAARTLREFTGARRSALREILERAPRTRSPRTPTSNCSSTRPSGSCGTGCCSSTTRSPRPP
jgi:AcrR family transcriptional regulator